MQNALIRIVAAAAGSALALMPGAMWAQGPSDADRYAHGPLMMWWDGSRYGMVFGPLLMILVLAIVIAVAVSCPLDRWAMAGNTAASHAAGAHIPRHSQRALCSQRGREGRVRGAATCARRMSRLHQFQSLRGGTFDDPRRECLCRSC